MKADAHDLGVPVPARAATTESAAAVLTLTSRRAQRQEPLWDGPREAAGRSEPGPGEVPAAAGRMAGLRAGEFWMQIEPFVVRSLHERVVKPLLDRVLAVLLLLAALPIIAVAALALRPQIGPGPVVLRQQRVGLGGDRFTMYKLRTMRPDRRRRHEPFEGRDRRLSHKTVEDPRHTPRGRLVRKLSIDELPQLWNVVKGEMSLVGPRPELVEVVERFALQNHPRHRVKPGLTGPWQVSADRNLPLHQHLDRDLAYLVHITFWGDLTILARTVSAVVHRRGS